MWWGQERKIWYGDRSNITLLHTQSGATITAHQKTCHTSSLKWLLHHPVYETLIKKQYQYSKIRTNRSTQSGATISSHKATRHTSSLKWLLHHSVYERLIKKQYQYSKISTNRSTQSGATISSHQATRHISSLKWLLHHSVYERLIKKQFQYSKTSTNRNVRKWNSFLFFARNILVNPNSNASHTHARISYMYQRRYIIWANQNVAAMRQPWILKLMAYRITNKNN